MRQGGNSTGKWWASAGCAGLVIASAFIAATLYLGGPPVSQSATGRPALAPGPDPVSQAGPGPSLVRRKGAPLWPSSTTTTAGTTTASTTTTAGTTTSGDSTEEAGWDLAEGESEGVTVSATSTTASTTPSTTSTTTAGSSTTHKRTGHHRHRLPASRPRDIDWDEILHSVNRSLSPRLNQRLNEIANLDPAALIKNTSSLVSFGLLAVDLFLLHNVQRIAFTETAGKQLSQDPEVVALNSLFEGAAAAGEERQQRRGGVVGEVMGFLQGAVRGVVNLGRAYRRAHRARAVGPTPLDCIWTLYCRNLDKTAKLGGPYGFLARMNSLGLRLMLGEFAPEDALERLMSDMSAKGSKLDCNTLFPRCGAEEAKRVVLATAQGLGDRGIQV